MTLEWRQRLACPAVGHPKVSIAGKINLCSEQFKSTPGKGKSPRGQTVAHCCLGTVPRLPSRLQCTELPFGFASWGLGRDKWNVREKEARETCRQTNVSGWRKIQMQVIESPKKMMLNQTRGQILREGTSIRKQRRAHWSFLPLTAVFCV